MCKSLQGNCSFDRWDVIGSNTVGIVDPMFMNLEPRTQSGKECAEFAPNHG